MINKRLLIKNIISHNDECTFFDKKRSIDISSSKGKAKFLKHVCALSNSNPLNDAFIIIGVTDDNKFVGADFIDDSTIQNLVKANLVNAPVLKYENISFPEITKDKSIGLLTIRNNGHPSSFFKRVSSIEPGTVFHRIGSISEPTTSKINAISENGDIINSIYTYSKNSVKDILDKVFEFFNLWDDSYSPSYVVFKDQFVVCWAGYKTEGNFYSEVDIQLINEGKRLFFSALETVTINITDDSINIIEYQKLGFEKNFKNYPVHLHEICFENNGTYKTSKEFIFTPPKFDETSIKKLYNSAINFSNKLKGNELISDSELDFGEGLASYFFLCYLNGIKQARQDFFDVKQYLDGSAAEVHSICLKLLQNYEYNLYNN